MINGKLITGNGTGLAGIPKQKPADYFFVKVTQHFRKQSWSGTDRVYVISMDHAGNPIGIDEAGRVVSFGQDAGEMVEIANDLEQYLQRCLALVRIE